MNEPCRIGIIGVGQRGGAYIKLARSTPRVELVALCDTDACRLHDFAMAYDCAAVPQFTEPDVMFRVSELDAVVITVPDYLHAEVAVTALRHGMHIMLEKPMAPTAAECREILAARTSKSQIIQLGFVLREHPMYKQIKAIVESGRLGQIMSVAAEESIGVMHGASYMRRWHRKVANSGGFILAKCSHDIDLISWIVDALPVRVASFGDCNFFRPEKQMAQFCSVCTDQGCRFRFHGELVVMSEAEKANPSKSKFDLCVYNADKDVVDNQVTILEYGNGIRAVFSLNLFAPQAGRTIRLVGTEGYLEGNTVNNRIKVSSSIGLQPVIYDCQADNDSGHGGSDQLFFEEFVRCICSDIPPKVDYQAGLAATVVGNAIELARSTGKVVRIEPQEYSLEENRIVNMDAI